MYLIYVNNITIDIAFIGLDIASFVNENVLYRYKRFRIASCGNVMLIEDKKWLKKLALPLLLLLVLDQGVFPVRQFHRQMRECCSMAVHLSTLLFRKVSMSGTHISAECLVLAYISRNTVAKAINMFMVSVVVPDVPHIKTEAVTSAIGRQKKFKYS